MGKFSFSISTRQGGPTTDNATIVFVFVVNPLRSIFIAIHSLPINLGVLAVVVSLEV